MNKQAYKTNKQPKVGDIVRCCRDMEEKIDRLFKVEAVRLGRVENKVFIRPLDLPNGEPNGMELYYYCLCPQTLTATDLCRAVADLTEVLKWVAPIVDLRTDQWKADKLRKAISIAKLLILPTCQSCGAPIEVGPNGETWFTCDC